MTDEQQSITYAFPRTMSSNIHALGRVWRSKEVWQSKEGVEGFNNTEAMASPASPAPTPMDNNAPYMYGVFSSMGFELTQLYALFSGGTLLPPNGYAYEATRCVISGTDRQATTVIITKFISG